MFINKQLWVFIRVRFIGLKFFIAVSYKIRFWKTDVLRFVQVINIRNFWNMYEYFDLTTTVGNMYKSMTAITSH